MITCDLRGQLANQCFIISTVIAHSLKTGVPYFLPQRSGKWGQFPMMFDHLPVYTYNNGFSNIYKEQKFGIYNQLPDPINGNLHIQGYFQSFRYFDDYKKEVITELRLPNVEYERNKNDRRGGHVSIHIRRGDSLNHVKKLPQPTDDYFKNALEVFGEDYVFVVFSDDVPYCKEYFKKFDKYQFEYCEEPDAKKSMALMASLDHNIIVNSTFSLFASWLNDNLYKQVVCPHRDSWFGDGYKHLLSAEDIVPHTYTQIKY
jgi:hypothetical protein